ncbi:phosphoinositide-3-kinase-interacting protein 1 isoform X2 [Rhinoraja longicauda]
MKERGCLQVAMDPSGDSPGSGDRSSSSSARGTGDRDGGVALPGLKLAALLLHLLAVVGAAPRPGASVNEDHNETTREPETVKPGVSAAQTDEQVKPPSGREPGVQLPVSGGTSPVRQPAKRKRDLGVLGQAMAIGMIIIIIFLGSGITVGYIYKRGQAIKKEQEQRAREQEIQRIMLPLSAFTNPSCELEDEVTVMVNPQAQIGEDSEVDSSLAAATGTPGA